MRTVKLYSELAVFLLICVAALVVPSLTASKRNAVCGQNVSKTSMKPAKEKSDDDKTLSPYFYVNSGDQSAESLPMKSTSADVKIVGVIADVKVSQVYMNTGRRPIEAIYIFPASTRAAVYSMRMYVGNRILTAKIQEKQQARQNYEQAKQQGRSATLLEQQRPNVFQMNVANIMPGDTIKVELCYTELLIPESSVYEFVYPTVVGPRYSNKPEATASANEKWVSNPYLHESEQPTYTFDFTASISTGMPIKQVACPTHDLVINYDGPSNANLTFRNKGTFEGNRDVIIQYKLTDDKIESGLLLFQGKDGEENFFLTMIEPPQRPTPSQIPAREYVFIMDVSGSMYGFPIETSKKLMKNLVSNLNPTDKFNLMLFAGSASVLSEQSLFATKENLDKAMDMIDRQQGGGGTELLPALKKALAIDKAKGFSRTFVIATDGYVDVEKESFDLIRDNLGKANFFAFGIGSSVNRYLIEGIATAGMGESFIVTKPDECDAKAERFRNYVQTPVLTDIKVDFDKFQVYDVEPKYVPDVLAERPVIIIGKWKGQPQGTITVKGTSGKSDFTWTKTVVYAAPMDKHGALKYLWARQKIRMLDDMGGIGDTKVQQEVTSLGLKYNLLTNYTSFIAIDSVVRNAGGEQLAVKQPLPLPDGVSDYAVGGAGVMSTACKSVSNSSYSYNNNGVGTSGGSGKASGYPSLSYQSGNKQKCVAAESSDSMEAISDSSTTAPTAAYYLGGEQAMKSFIEKNIVLPQKAKDAGITGKVTIQFTVEANGEITNVKVIKGLGYGCDEEAIRIVKLMKGFWVAATQHGVNISSKHSVQIKF